LVTEGAWARLYFFGSQAKYLPKIVEQNSYLAVAHAEQI
jgi:hypothetical protein